MSTIDDLEAIGSLRRSDWLNTDRRGRTVKCQQTWAQTAAKQTPHKRFIAWNARRSKAGITLPKLKCLSEPQ